MAIVFIVCVCAGKIHGNSFRTSKIIQIVIVAIRENSAWLCSLFAPYVQNNDLVRNLGISGAIKGR